MSVVLSMFADLANMFRNASYMQATAFAHDRTKLNKRTTSTSVLLTQVTQELLHANINITISP